MDGLGLGHLKTNLQMSIPRRLKSRSLKVQDNLNTHSEDLAIMISIAYYNDCLRFTHTAQSCFSPPIISAIIIGYVTNSCHHTCRISMYSLIHRSTSTLRLQLAKCVTP